MRLRDMNPGEALAAAAAMTLRLGGFSKAAELMGELLMDTWAANFPGALGAYHRLTEYMCPPPPGGSQGTCGGISFYTK